MSDLDGFVWLALFNSGAIIAAIIAAIWCILKGRNVGMLKYMAIPLLIFLIVTALMHRKYNMDLDNISDDNKKSNFDKRNDDTEKSNLEMFKKGTLGFTIINGLLLLIYILLILFLRYRIHKKHI